MTTYYKATIGANGVEVCANCGWVPSRHAGKEGLCPDIRQKWEVPSPQIDKAGARPGAVNYAPDTKPTPEGHRLTGYESLQGVLQRAYDQAAKGKGAERHADGKPFDEQPMQQLIRLYGIGFALGQAGKKAQEAQRMDTDAAVRELLGAINYLAGAIIALESTPPSE